VDGDLLQRGLGEGLGGDLSLKGPSQVFYKSQSTLFIYPKQFRLELC